MAAKNATAAFKRPYGEISLMIGMKNRELHCTDGLFNRSLRLWRTSFSQGWVLNGYSHKLEATLGRSLLGGGGHEPGLQARQMDTTSKIVLAIREVMCGQPRKQCREKMASNVEHEYCPRGSLRRKTAQSREETAKTGKHRQE